MDSPEDRIRIIRQSLRCFTLGWLSLIPLIGLGLGVLAIVLHFKVWTGGGATWNPARPYLLWGFVLAWFGGLISMATLALFLLILMKNYGF